MAWVATGNGGAAATGIWGGGTTVAAPKPKKPAEPRWYEKAIDVGAGVLGGLVQTGYHAVADPIGEVVTGGNYESTIDDIGMSIVDDYKKRYSSWEDFKSDPVAGALDVLTVAAAFFTAGGSLAARTAATGASVGKAAKVAGLTQSADLTTLGRMVGTSHPSFIKAVASEEARAAAAVGKKGMIDKGLSGQTGRVIVREDGTVLVPRRGVLRGIDGSELETIPLAQSPLKRLMQTSGHGISNRSPKRGVIGSEVRAGKQQNRVNRILDENAVAATLGAGGARAVRKAAKKMSPEEEAALFARNTVGEAAEGSKGLGKFYGKQADELEAALALPSHRKARIADEAVIGTQVLKAATHGGKVNAKQAEEFARHAADGFREELAANPGDQVLLRKMASANKIAEKAAQPDFEDYVNHKWAMNKAMGEADTILPALRLRQEMLTSDAVEQVFRAPTKLMLRVEKVQGRASKYTTEFIKGDLNKAVREDVADGTMLARMALGRDLTPEEAAALIVRPHSRVQGKAVTAREMRGKYQAKPSAPKTKPGTVPEFSKFSRGYNFAYALDSMTPAAVFKVWNEARAFKAKTRVLKAAAASGIRIEDDAQRRMFASHPDFEIVGGKNDLVKKAALLRDKLDNEVRLIAGDSIVREQTSEVLQELLERHVDEAAEWAMPRVYYKHLTQELNRADNFVTRLIDTPTAIFRAAVLNLRPAWMVNNFIGQSMLLMYSQGVLHGVREYMTEINRAAKAGEFSVAGRTIKYSNPSEMHGILGEKAGALSQGAGTQANEWAEAGLAAEKGVGLGRLTDLPGLRRVKDSAGKPEGSLAAHTLNVAVKGLPSGLKGLSNFMGRVNSVLTDDIPRRAAFMGEARPLIQRAQKLDPSLSTEDALRLVLADDDVAARLIDRTMGDLIDFSRMNQAEREVVRRLLPFYGWFKGITLRTGRMVRDDPHQALVSYQLGKQYVAGSEERLGGEVDGALKGALKFGEDENGNPRIITTNGMNIFQTPADIAGIAANLLGKGEMKLGGTHPFAQFNPIIKAPIEVAMGRDLFYGGPLYSDPSKRFNTGILDKPWTPEDESASKPVAIANRYLASLGPMALYEKYRRAGAFGEEEQRLLVRDKSDSLMSYFGPPPSTLNVEKAEEMARSAVQYGLVRYDPTKGEAPGVFGRQQQSTTSTGVFT